MAQKRPNRTPAILYGLEQSNYETRDLKEVILAKIAIS